MVATMLAEPMRRAWCMRFRRSFGSMTGAAPLPNQAETPAGTLALSTVRNSRAG